MQGRALFTVFTAPCHGGRCVCGVHGRPVDSSLCLRVLGAREAVLTQSVVAQDVCRRRDQGSCEGGEGRSVCFKATRSFMSIHRNPAEASRQAGGSVTATQVS